MHTLHLLQPKKRNLKRNQKRKRYQNKNTFVTTKKTNEKDIRTKTHLLQPKKQTKKISEQNSQS